MGGNLWNEKKAGVSEVFWGSFMECKKACLSEVFYMFWDLIINKMTPMTHSKKGGYACTCNNTNYICYWQFNLQKFDNPLKYSVIWYFVFNIVKYRIYKSEL